MSKIIYKGHSIKRAAYHLLQMKAEKHYAVLMSGTAVMLHVWNGMQSRGDRHFTAEDFIHNQWKVVVLEDGETMRDGVVVPPNGAGGGA